MKHLLVIPLLLLTFVANAQTPTMNVGLAWTAPTARTDGTALQPSELTGFVVLCDTQSRQGTTANYTLSYTAPGTARAFSKEELMTLMGVTREVTYYCALRAVAMCDGSSCNSGRSAEVSFIIPAETLPQSRPQAPVLTVQEGANVAYTIVQSENRFALVPVGTVSAGTECDTAQEIRDANGVQGYVVPRSAVQWAGTVRPQVVVAQCG